MPTTLSRSDAELVGAARGGDHDAVREVLDRHLPSVTAMCRQRLQSTADVEDAVQETVERTIRNLDQLRDPDAVGAWMRGIAARVCKETYRVHRRGPVCVPSSDLPERATSADGVEDDLLRRAEAQDVHDQLSDLSERDRLALWLRDALGVSVAEVAEELGVTSGSARVLLSRARGRLRESFKGVAAVLGGVRVSLRDVLDRVTRAPTVDWGVVAQAAAAVAAATVVSLPGGGTPAEATDALTLPDITTGPAWSDLVPEPVATVAEEPVTVDVDPVRPGPPADAAPASEDTAPTERRLDRKVGPVVVTEEDPEDDPEMTIGIVDPAGDTVEGALHAGNVELPIDPTDDVFGTP